MDKMKAISWDKLRRLMGRKKSKDRDTDSSRFQRSYSFKRASVRKSGRRVASGGAALGAAAIAAAAAASSSGTNSSNCNGSSSNGNGTETGSSALVSRHQHEQFHKSNGQLSSCSTSSNNSSAPGNKLPKSGYQEVTVNVDVIADGKNILKQEQVFELKLGGHQKEPAADVKVALVPQHKRNTDKYGSSTNLCDNNNLERSSSGNKHSSSVAIVPDAVMNRCMSPLPSNTCHDDKKNGLLQESRHGELSAYEDEDDEAIMNKWIRMRNQCAPIGRRQRAENIYRMMAEDDSDYLDEEDLGGRENVEDKFREEMVSPVPNRNPQTVITRGDGSRRVKGVGLQQKHSIEADGEVFEDEFYLAMLAESPRPLRRSTDSALSRLTSDSSQSRSKSRLDDNLDYAGGGVGIRHQAVDRRESDSRSRSRLLSACSSSALDLVHESNRQLNPYHHNNSSNNSGNNSNNSNLHRRRQQSPSAAVSPIPPPHMVPRPPSSCAQTNIIRKSSCNNNIIPVQKKGRANRDIHKSTDDLVSDKNSPDSGSYHHHPHHYGSSGKLSESKHGSGSSVSCSRDDLVVDSKEVSPSPDLHLSPSHHAGYPVVGEIHSASTEMLLSRQPPYSASSSSTYRTGLDDPTATPKSFWWTQKPGSTMTTSSGASKDSGFSLGRSWAWGLAHKVFGKRAHVKGPILSVSKEGYFQRTNLRRVSGRRPAYPIPLRSSVTRRSSTKKRRSARGRRNNANISAASAASMSVTHSADTSNNSMSSNNQNNHRASINPLSSSPSLPSSPTNLVKSTSIDNIIEDLNDHHIHHRNIQSMDNDEIEDDIISKTSKLVITSTPSRCTSPTLADYPDDHNENINFSHNHEDPLFDEQPVNIYQTHALMTRRQRMLERQQQHQQFQVFATPNSSEPLIFVPPERRKSYHPSSAAVVHSKRKQPVPYSKTVFEIRNHCLPLIVPGVAGPIMEQEPVELLRLPRLRCDKIITSCEKSVLITKVSGPYDNDGRLSRASCASGNSSNGISSNSAVVTCNGGGGDGGQQIRQVGHGSNGKLGDCTDKLSPCGSSNSTNINRCSIYVGRRSPPTSQHSHHHQNHPQHHHHHHQIKQYSDIDGIRPEGPGRSNNNSRRNCKIRDKVPCNSLNDDDDDYVDDDVDFEDVHEEIDENGSHLQNHYRNRQQNLRKNNIDNDHVETAVMLRKGSKCVVNDDDDEYEVEDQNCVPVSEKGIDSDLNGCVANGKVSSRGIKSSSTNNGGISSNAVRRKQSTRRTNNNHHHHNRPSKVITKPTAVAVYRRYSTLYRRAKLGPNFALPRPTVKIGECD